MFWERRKGKARLEVSFNEIFKTLIGKIENSRGDRGLPRFSTENTGQKGAKPEPQPDPEIKDHGIHLFSISVFLF